MSELKDKFENTIMEKQKPKRKKDKSVKHGGVISLIPIETDSNAEDEAEVYSHSNS